MATRGWSHGTGLIVVVIGVISRGGSIRGPRPNGESRQSASRTSRYHLAPCAFDCSRVWFLMLRLARVTNDRVRGGGEPVVRRDPVVAGHRAQESGVVGAPVALRPALGGPRVRGDDRRSSGSIRLRDGAQRHCSTRSRDRVVRADRPLPSWAALTGNEPVRCWLVVASIAGGDARARTVFGLGGVVDERR